MLTLPIKFSIMENILRDKQTPLEALEICKTKFSQWKVWVIPEKPQVG